MKKLALLFVFVQSLVFAQGEQRYADGTATDQDGNTFEWINYGDLDWAIDNAEVVTYRDGTAIPQVAGNAQWENLTTGAWCYYNNDSSKGKLYNWYAVMGIHDNDDSTPNKEFAPDGWKIPSEGNWTNFVEFLIANEYNYDGSSTENKLAKAVASISGWHFDNKDGVPGNNQSANNRSGFNSLGVGKRCGDGNCSFSDFVFLYDGNGVSGIQASYYWSSDSASDRNDATYPRSIYKSLNYAFIKNNFYDKRNCMSVRFVRDASTASKKDYTNAITIYPNPTSSIINIEQDFKTAKVYDISGRELLKTTSKTIDLSELPSSIYLLRLYDKSNKVLGTSMVVKQ